ncbi:unnamed protein product [Merluccius merluccius]
MTSNRRWSCHVPVVLFLLVSAAALSSQVRVCEPYADPRGRAHFGFHCPRLSDNRTFLFCCYHNNTAFKYCCNDTEYRSIMRTNATAGSGPDAQTDYVAVVGVWVYGSLVLALILVDFLYYAAANCELCGVYLAKWGLGGRWLTQVQRQRRRHHQSGAPAAVLRQAIALRGLVCSGCLDPRCHQQQQEPQERKPGQGTDDQHRPNT